MVIAASFAWSSNAAAQSSGNGMRPPDSHDLRRERGDVLAVSGATPPARDLALARYIAPYRGWRYRPLRPGDRLQRGFLRPRYVLVDPRLHGLPFARAKQRWIRYGDDLVLVEFGSRRVVRVAAIDIHGKPRP